MSSVVSSTPSIKQASRWGWLLRWPATHRKTIYLCMAILGSCVFVMAIYGIKLWTEYKRQTPGHPPEFGDFLALWSYGKIIAGHPAAMLYDSAGLHALQVALGMPEHAHNPFPYPPSAIPLFRLLGFLPYQPAYAAWALGTLALFVWAVIATCSRMAINVIGVIVAPVSISCLAAGQSGFLSAALLIAGLRLAGSRPILGGIMIGLLSCKPQMALLVPIAFIASGYWRAFAAACVTVIGLAVLATVAYGTGIWAEWLSMLPAYSTAFDADPVGTKFKPTIMANLQLLGLSLPVAKTIQGLTILIVAGLVWRCFRRDRGRLAAAALLVGTVLSTPHAFIYDLPIVAAAIALLIQDRMETNPVFGLGEIAILILGFGFPLLMMLDMHRIALPFSTAPLLLLFGLILREARRASHRLP